MQTDRRPPSFGEKAFQLTAVLEERKKNKITRELPGLGRNTL